MVTTNSPDVLALAISAGVRDLPGLTGLISRLQGLAAAVSPGESAAITEQPANPPIQEPIPAQAASGRQPGGRKPTGISAALASRAIALGWTPPPLSPPPAKKKPSVAKPANSGLSKKKSLAASGPQSAPPPEKKFPKPTRPQEESLALKLLREEMAIADGIMPERAIDDQDQPVSRVGRARITTGRGTGRRPKSYGNEPPDLSPEQIAEACKEIQSRWTEAERRNRRFGDHAADPVSAKDAERLGGAWTPQVVADELLERRGGLVLSE